MQQGSGVAESGEQRHQGKIDAGDCIGLHTALALTQTSPPLKGTSASYPLTPQTLTHMHRAVHNIMDASLQFVNTPAVSILDRHRANLPVRLQVLVCCWY
jgi:hypothetical protein